MEYEIAEAYSLISLVEDVNYMINDGWEPLGGVAVSGVEEKTYIQAMIKSE